MLSKLSCWTFTSCSCACIRFTYLSFLKYRYQYHDIFKILYRHRIEIEILISNYLLWKHRTLVIRCTVIITTFVIHHPIFLSFQSRYFSLSQILPSVVCRHLAPLWTDFTDVWTCLRLFFLLQFFQVIVVVISFYLVLLIWGNFLIFFHLTKNCASISVSLSLFSFKHFSSFSFMW